MANQVDRQRWDQIVQQLNNCMKQCDYAQTKNRVQEEILNFMKINPNCLLSVEAHQEKPGSALKKLVAIKGKLLIQLVDNVKMIGFKYVLTSFFPFQPPKVFLDEPITKKDIEFIDYVDEGNVINFQFLNDWTRYYNTHPQNFTLQKLLIQVNILFSNAPPIPLAADVDNYVNLNNSPQQPFKQNPPSQGNKAPAQPNPNPNLNVNGNKIPQKVELPKKVNQIKPEEEDNYDIFFGQKPSHADRQSIFKLNHIVEKNNQEKEQKAKIMSQITPKISKIVNDFEAVKTAEAEVNMRKLEKFNTKNEIVKKNMQEIKSQNQQLKQTTEEIKGLLNTIPVLKEEDSETKIETILDNFKKAQTPHALKLIEFESKYLALEECQSHLKMNEDIPPKKMIEIIRKLTNKQFKLMLKKNKLLWYMQQYGIK